MLAKVFLCFTFIANGAFITNGGILKEPGSPSLPLYYFGSSVYYFQSFFTATQEEGDLFCKNLDMGLVNIESKQENDFLFQTIEILVDFEMSKFWTSGLRSDKIWYWTSTGKAFSYSNWPGAEPTDEGDCLEIIHDSTKITMAWNNSNCNDTNYVICEGESSVTTTTATTVSLP